MSESSEAAIPSYPVVSFPRAMEVARAVSDSGGVSNDVQKSIIAKLLETSSSSGAFLQRLATARAYGMIKGRGKFQLTENAKHYFFPESDNAKRRALLTFLSSPAIFDQIIKRFDGNKIPEATNLANVLRLNMNVSESWKDRIAAFFIKTADMLGVVDQQGFLRYRATLEAMDAETSRASNGGVEAPPLANSRPADSSPPSNGNVVARRATNDDANTWVYSLKGQMVRLETSDGELSPALWQKLNAYVQVLKPSEEE